MSTTTTTTAQTPEALIQRKVVLEGLLKKFQIIYRQKVWEHEDHVQRSYFAVTTGILSILNRNEKASATYRRSLNADIQLHCKIQLRNLFLLRIRERVMKEEIEAIKNQLQAMGHVVEEPSSESDDASLGTNSQQFSGSDNGQQLAATETESDQQLSDTDGDTETGIGDQLSEDSGDPLAETETVSGEQLAATEAEAETEVVGEEDADLTLDPTEDPTAA